MKKDFQKGKIFNLILFLEKTGVMSISSIRTITSSLYETDSNFIEESLDTFIVGDLEDKQNPD